LHYRDRAHTRSDIYRTTTASGSLKLTLRNRDGAKMVGFFHHAGWNGMAGLGTREEVVVTPINAGGVATMILQQHDINIAAMGALIEAGSATGMWSDSPDTSGIVTFA